MPEPKDHPGPWMARQSRCSDDWVVESRDFDEDRTVAWGLSEADARLIASLEPEAEPGMIPEIIKTLEGLIEKIRKA